jgi:ribosomal 50S subunit-associated protein YjgA (DUF615 family)
MQTLEQNVFTKSQKVAGVRIVRRIRLKEVTLRKRVNLRATRIHGGQLRALLRAANLEVEENVPPVAARRSARNWPP